MLQLQTSSPMMTPAANANMDDTDGRAYKVCSLILYFLFYSLLTTPMEPTELCNDPPISATTTYKKPKPQKGAQMLLMFGVSAPSCILFWCRTRPTHTRLPMQVYKPVTSTNHLPFDPSLAWTRDRGAELEHDVGISSFFSMRCVTQSYPPCYANILYMCK